MYNRIKYIFFLSTAILTISTSCKKGTFDINDNNPNSASPGSVSINYSLTAALNTTASLSLGGNQDFMNYYMGYTAVSGDYIPSNSVVLYQLNTDFGSGNWDDAYLNLTNYQLIEQKSVDASYNNYKGMAGIMEAFVLQRVVDIYNNAPYTDALQAPSGGQLFPKYDDGKSIYSSLITKIDSAKLLLSSTAANPGSFDILFKGDITKWTKFANTLKLKILLRQTQTSGGDGYIKSQLTGLTASNFLGANENAGVNPGYANSANAKQNPQWQNIGFNTSGTANGNNSYYRANKYAVDFYNSLKDPRVSYFYEAKGDGKVYGRSFGSTALEHNADISGFGPGILKSASQDALILPAYESLFLQAEAAQRGYITDDPAVLYTKAVKESFKTLGVTDYESEATTYLAQADDKVNFASSTNKIRTIILQKWAALNLTDPLESWSDWRRLNIPSNLPVSIYPGATATHIPYRILYPTSEYNYNAANVKSQGTVDPFTSKIFWQP